MIKSLLVAVIFIFSFLFSYAQYTISGASPISTCTGTFLDDGDGGPYNDQSYTFTICPDTPGDVIQIDFVAFNIAINPGDYPQSDFLSIFDGDNTGAAGLGNYTGTDLNGLVVTGSYTNVTGCLTFVFTSNTGNAAGLPGWEGLISCTTPCATPTAVSSFTSPETINEGLTVTVCMNSPISVSGAGSFVEPGFTLDHYSWNFDDGTIDVTSGINATHSFSEPGEYLVSLTVVDNNGCQSLNLEPLQVLVSTLPEVTLEYDESVCFGETLEMTGSAEGITWTSLPPQVVSGETYLADGAGFSYNSTLEFDFFEPGAELETCDDLLSVVVNMEHSYLGDLGINIECPNGTIVELLSWGNDGGGTYLGEACDQMGNTTVAGVGYDYGWAPGLTNGNVDDDNSSSVTFIDNEGQNVTNQVVDPGLYESDQDMCNLVGCPLNGAWTFTVTDNLAIDNGYIFEWGINFNPELFPDVTTFTPTIGQDIDSTWWTGPATAEIIDEGNTIIFIPDAPGFFDFTYNTMNSFGCGYDTTITVEIWEMADIEAWPDVVVDCEEPTQVGVNIIDGLVTDYDFSWTPIDYFANPTLQNPTANGINGTTVFEVTVNVEEHPACFKTDYMTVSVPGELLLDPDTAICGMEYQLNATSVGLGEWTIPAGLTITGSGNPYNDPNAFITADLPGLYTITWTDTEGLSCPNTKDLIISFFDGIDIDPVVTDAMCFGECSGEVSVTGVGGMIAGDYTYVFPNADPMNVTGNTATGLCPGSQTVTLIDDNGCFEMEGYFIAEPPMPIIDSLIAEREECADFCNGSIVVVSNEATQYSYDGGLTYGADGARNDLCSDSYTIFIKDDNGCIGGPLNAFVGSPTAPEADFTADPAPVDILDPKVFFTNNSESYYGDYTSDWVFNLPDPVGTSDETNPVFIFPTEAGSYPVQLTITDSIGCSNIIILNILVNDVLQLYIPNSFTPNEDGINDIFEPIGSDIDPSYYNFVVYSRWGDKVYESNTYPHSWNGSMFNKKDYYVPNGSYSWHMITKSKTTSEKIELNGDILIMR